MASYIQQRIIKLLVAIECVLFLRPPSLLVTSNRSEFFGQAKNLLNEIYPSELIYLSMSEV